MKVAKLWTCDHGSKSVRSCLKGSLSSPEIYCYDRVDYAVSDYKKRWSEITSGVS